MNALELLKQDHRKVSDLFEQADKTENEKTRHRLFDEIKVELETHTHIEETVLYPFLEQKEEFKDLVLEAYEEHKQVKTLLREIERLVDGSEKFDAKLKVMSENVEHHVKEEEEEMFPKVEKVFPEEQLEELGAQLSQAKKEFGKKTQTKASSK